MVWGVAPNRACDWCMWTAGWSYKLHRHVVNGLHCSTLRLRSFCTKECLLIVPHSVSSIASRSDGRQSLWYNYLRSLVTWCCAIMD